MKPNDVVYAYYGRKSSESDERQIQSLDDQERYCTKLAAAGGLQVTHSFSEAKSAKEPCQRPAFDALVQLLKSGKVQGIVCWKLDRLSRNPDEAGIIIGMLQRGQIRHIKTSERDYLSDDNTLITYMEFGIANQAIRDLAKNVKRGLESKVEKGWRPGIAPQGYANTKLAERGTNYILVDDERFALIRRAWDLMLTGCHLPREILDLLNNDWGFRTRPARKRGGRPLSLAGLYRIFTNPFYAGLIVYGAYSELGKHPAMVSVAEFDRVQHLLGRAGKPRRTRHIYAFNGIIHCGECGGFVSATHKEKRLLSTGELKAYTLYYCTASKRGDCSQYYTNVERIEEQIERRLATVAITPFLRDWAIDILERERGPNDTTEVTIRQTREKALADTKRQTDVLTDLRVRELIDDEEFEARRTTLRVQAARLRAQLGEDREAQQERDELTAKTFRFATYAHGQFLMPDPSVKRQIVTEFSSNCSLRDQEVSIHAIPRYLVLENELPSLMRKIEAFEPGKYGSDEWEIEARAKLNPLMCALVNAVRTAAQQEIASLGSAKPRRGT